MRKLTLALVLAFTAPAVFAQEIKGTVKVSPEMEKRVTPTAVLYVIARPAGVKSGPPLAVVRIPSPKFPQAFEIGAKNVMAGGEFKGPLQLSAKLSKSGDPMTNSGDLLGDAKSPNTPPAKDVEVILSKAAP